MGVIMGALMITSNRKWTKPAAMKQPAKLFVSNIELATTFAGGRAKYERLKRG